MTVHLLDVNVLIALLDPHHVAHDLASGWFADHAGGGWASCPLTQNAVLRIVGSKSYDNSPGSPSAVLPSLLNLVASPGHEFWPDDFSLLDADIVAPERLLSGGQVTDTYLLAMAARRDGRLATLDRRLVTTAVRDGARHLHVIR